MTPHNAILLSHTQLEALRRESSRPGVGHVILSTVRGARSADVRVCELADSGRTTLRSYRVGPRGKVTEL